MSLTIRRPSRMLLSAIACEHMFIVAVVGLTPLGGSNIITAPENVTHEHVRDLYGMDAQLVGISCKRVDTDVDYNHRCMVRVRDQQTDQQELLEIECDYFGDCGPIKQRAGWGNRF